MSHSQKKKGKGKGFQKQQGLTWTPPQAHVTELKGLYTPRGLGFRQWVPVVKVKAFPAKQWSGGVRAKQQEVPSGQVGSLALAVTTPTAVHRRNRTKCWDSVSGAQQSGP